MRYKPGSRCTILYQLEYAAEAATHHNVPQAVVAKTHHGDKGKHAYAVMRDLWNSPLSTSREVTIAEPLVYIAEVKLLMQRAIRGERTLKELLVSSLRASTPQAISELEAYLRKAAIGLAELHRCGVSRGERVAWEDELAEIREHSARLAVAMPHLGDALTPLLARLEVLAAQCPADPAVPSHRSFRLAQVLLDHGQIGFIDFDGFCQAEPSLDLAMFLTQIRHFGSTLNADEGDENQEIRDQQTSLTHLNRLEAVCQVFLSEYTARLPVSPQRLALWETLDLLAILQGSWIKVKPGRLSSTLVLLERHLRANGFVDGSASWSVE
jgi:aminoglycoside phosphotransferase (APT) family kinase protein